MRNFGLKNAIGFSICIVLVIGLITGSISFTSSRKISQKEREALIIQNILDLEYITGNLYVSPYDSFDPFAKDIQYTQKSGYFQTYDFTNRDIKSLFYEKLNQGTDIKMIVENQKYQQFQNTFRQVQFDFSGYDTFQIKSDYQMGTEYVHAKIALFDDNFWIQTANLTYSSFAKNREHFFTSSHTGVYQSLLHIFQKDWNGEEILIQDIHPNLVICNINCRTVIEELLSHAQESIIIQTQYIEDPSIFHILKKKSVEENRHCEEGLRLGRSNLISNIKGFLISLVEMKDQCNRKKQQLEMKLLLADTEINDKVLKYFGPQIAKALTETYNHTKTILIDHKLLLIGSMNLSTNSLDNNREIGILVTDPKVIKKFLDQFGKDWESGKGKW